MTHGSHPSHTPRRIAVIGAGPAGLFAAIRAARGGGRVVVLERMPRPGLKLLASGGGHANVTNTLSEEDFVARFGTTGLGGPGGENAAGVKRTRGFVKSALRALARDALLRLLESWGTPCHAPDGFHYFPRSGRAEDVLRSLLRQLDAFGVELRTGVPVTDLSIDEGAIRGVKTRDGDFEADAVILAAGGAGYPGLGGGRSGYDLARRAGHEIVPVVPGLVGLRTQETWPAQCTGIVVPDCEARILDPSCARPRPSWRGDLLFTHRGVSGPCILDASASVCRLLLSQPLVSLQLRIAKRGGHEKPYEWRTVLSEWRKNRGRSTARALLAETMPRRLAAALCDAHGIPANLTMSQISRETETQLLALLEGPSVHVVESEGFDQAMVTSGGVSLKEVKPATLESRLVSGLYFAGEILDIDGPEGGFNLQWATSSGWLAGGLPYNVL